MNFVFKMLLVVWMLSVMFYEQSTFYNAILIFILLLLAYTQKIRLFRYPSLFYSFLIFLTFIFLFRVISGFGEVYLTIPPGIRITDGGLRSAWLTVEQITLIFLLFGITLNSTSREEVAYYINRLGAIPGKPGRELQRLVRIALFVFYLLPRMFPHAREKSYHLVSSERKKRPWWEKYGNAVSQVGSFLVEMLHQSEQWYAQFLLDMSQKNFRPVSIRTPAHLLYLAGVVGLQGSLLWLRVK